MCRPIFIELFDCLCAERRLLNLSLACVQSTNYLLDFLLICIYRGAIGFLLKTTLCLCALLLLSNIFLAYVQTNYYWFLSLLNVHRRNYWTITLLLCINRVIETFSCLCATLRLLSALLAFVQVNLYWWCRLLVCKNKFIELPCCLCAVMKLLNALLAFVRLLTYLLDFLLICISFNIEPYHLLVCKMPFIDYLSCWCAI